MTRVLGGAALALLVLAASASLWLRQTSGLLLTIEPAGGRGPAVTRSAEAPSFRDADRQYLSSAAGQAAVWRGVLWVERGGPYRVWVKADTPLSLLLDGRTVLERRRGYRLFAVRREVSLSPGAHPFELALPAAVADTALKLRRAGPGEPLQEFSRGELWRRAPTPMERRTRRAVPLLWAGSLIGGAATLGGLVAQAWQRRRRGLAVLSPRAQIVARRLRGLAASRVAVHSLAAAVVLYAGLLRTEALVDRYGPPDTRPWARRLAAFARTLPPEDLRWSRVEAPYENEDPIAYLRHARNMRSFYEPRYREPFFVLAAKLGVAVSGGRDVGISVASAAFSVLLVAATYALGAYAVSPAVGLFAALGLALDEKAIAAGVAGWRDDAFAFLVACFALMALRLFDRGRFRDAVLLGLLWGAACLTRITALSLAPTFALLALVPRARPLRQRLERVAAAAALCAALVAPWLIGSWIAYGDPLHSVSGEVPYYAETETAERPAGVVDYFRQRLRQPFALLETALVGFTAYPFLNKWNLEHSWDALGPALAALSIGGLLLFLTRPRTRVLLAVLGFALVPFVFTWNIRQGSSWRLTLFAYPFYLVAAFAAGRAALRGIVSPAARGDLRRALRDRRVIAGGAAALLGAAALALAARLLPFLRVGQEVKTGGTAHVVAGPRDGLFFRRGWYRAICADNLCLRYSRGRRSVLSIPLCAGRDYDLLLRLDPFPFASMPPQRLAVRANGRNLGELTLAFDPARTGAYAVRWPAVAVVDGRNDLELEAAYATAVGSVDSEDPLADERWTTAFALWYVAVQPARGS